MTQCFASFRMPNSSSAWQTHRPLAARFSNRRCSRQRTGVLAESAASPLAAVCEAARSRRTCTQADRPASIRAPSWWGCRRCKQPCLSAVFRARSASPPQSSRPVLASSAPLRLSVSSSFSYGRARRRTRRSFGAAEAARTAMRWASSPLAMLHLWWVFHS